jgi:trimeric autotransporter adhesin
MEDIIDIIVTETTNLIEITSQPTDEVIDVNIIDNREDITLNVTPSVVEININSLTGNFGVEWGDITGTLSNQTDLNTALSLKADLVDGKVPSSQLPSYVDDVVEVANYASLPATGEVGKIYITLDTNFIYRWTGSTYVEIKDSSAVWGAITGTLSNQTDLQSALNLKANDNAVVHNTGNETIAGQKTFTGEVISTIQLTSPTIKVQNSGNASLYSLLLTNSSGIRNVYLPDADGTIALTSNLHNPVTLGTANGLSLSTQVLSLGLASSSANGALSSTDWTTFNNKLSTATAAATYVPYAGATGAVNLGAYDLTVNGITVGIGAGNMSSNTAIGASVLALNTNGSNNAALGYFSLNSNTTGGANTAIGSQTLKSNTNGTFNIAVGYGSLFNSVSANYNTAIGNSALYNTTGSSNTAIGDGAGYNITTGIFNTLIGGYFGTSSMSYNVILSDGARNIRFQFDGTNTLLGQSGNVLINTSTNAGYKLDVNGTGRFTGALSGTSATFSSTIFGNAPLNNTVITTSDATNITNGFNLLGSSSYWGIRTATSGNFNLDVYGAGAPKNALSIAQSTGAATFSSSVTAGQFYSSVSNGTNQLVLQTSGVDRGYIQASNSTLYLNSLTGNDIQFQGNGSTKMIITAGGNVGIGTTAPNTAIDARAVSSTTYSSTNLSAYQGAYFSNQGSGGFANITLNTLDAAQGSNCTTAISAVSETSGTRNSSMTFATREHSTGNIVERMRITSGGNVLVGTTSATPVSSNVIGINLSSGAQIQSSVDGRAVLLNRINDNGVTMEFHRGGTSVGNISVTTVSTTYNVTSDYRLKEDLKPINGLEIVNKIKVYDYKWKSEDSRMDGVLAHELAEVLPYAVTGVKDGEQMQSVDYSKIVPVMVQAIKDLKAELDTLKNK